MCWSRERGDRRDYSVFRRWYLQKRYGITTEQYRILLEKQGGKCAICRETPGKKETLAVDHDHITNTVRGLLCRSCNLVLGWAMDNPNNIERAVAYLAVNQVS